MKDYDHINGLNQLFNTKCTHVKSRKKQQRNIFTDKNKMEKNVILAD